VLLDYSFDLSFGKLLKWLKTNKVPWRLTFLWLGVVYLFNFQLTADHMFYQPKNKTMASGSDNKIAKNKLILGVVHNGQAKAYPIQLIGYHHQVIDTVGGTPMMITYCICRTDEYICLLSMANMSNLD
jgi:hypothetical protein